MPTDISLSCYVLNYFYLIGLILNSTRHIWGSFTNNYSLRKPNHPDDWVYLFVLIVSIVMFIVNSADASKEDYEDEQLAIANSSLMVIIGVVVCLVYLKLSHPVIRNIFSYDYGHIGLMLGSVLFFAIMFAIIPNSIRLAQLSGEPI